MIDNENVKLIILDDDDFVEDFPPSPASLTEEASKKSTTADIVLYEKIVIKNRFSL